MVDVVDKEGKVLCRIPLDKFPAKVILEGKEYKLVLTKTKKLLLN